MMDFTDRLGLPLLSPGQVQKESWHNEALLIVDQLWCGSIDPLTLAEPPASPTAGRCYRIAAGAGGDWTGHDGEVAVATAAGWRFVVPFEGLQLEEAGSGVMLRYAAGSWNRGILAASELRVGGLQVVGERQPAIGEPSGGVSVDAEARATLAAILAALRNHGLIA